MKNWITDGSDREILFHGGNVERVLDPLINELERGARRWGHHRGAGLGRELADAPGQLKGAT